MGLNRCYSQNSKNNKYFTPDVGELSIPNSPPPGYEVGKAHVKIEGKLEDWINNVFKRPKRNNGERETL